MPHRRIGRRPRAAASHRRARQGGRAITMLDALVPAADAFWRLARGEGATLALRAAATAAEAGAAATATMRPGLGRASYLGDRVIGIPDGGATAVALWLRALDRTV